MCHLPYHSPYPPQCEMMLAIDIETEGLMHQIPLPSITCVCLYDGSNEYSFVFYKVSPTLFDENKNRLLALLDASDTLVGFNAVLFDLEYIRRFFDLPQSQLSAWVLKTVDPFMCMKLHLGKTCTLKSMLALNGLPSKSASGLQAIRWAKEVSLFFFGFVLYMCSILFLFFRGKQGRMDLVIDYCMMDTKLVYMLCQQPHIRLTDFCTAQLIWQKNDNRYTWSITKESIVVPTLQETLHKDAEKMMVYSDHLAAQGLVTFAFV